MFFMLEMRNKWSKGNETNTTCIIYLSSEIAAPWYLLSLGQHSCLEPEHLEQSQRHRF